MSDLFIQNFPQNDNPNLLLKSIFSNNLSFFDIYCQISKLEWDGNCQSFKDFYEKLPEEWTDAYIFWHENIKYISEKWKLSHAEWRVTRICEKIFELKERFNVT